MMRRGLLTIALLCGACVTTKDSVGGGDSRLDDTGKREDVAAGGSRRECGPDAKGDVVLLDARTGGPLTCLAVSVSVEPMSCPVGGDCTSDLIFKGLTNARGQVAVKSAFSQARLVAVADGFDPSYLSNASLSKDKVLELELVPADGFWLKVLDAEGNYLQDVAISFKQGDAVIAHLRTNSLANVFFSQRQPFSGEPVVAMAEGYQSVTIDGTGALGDDGHTLVLKK
jgi:hypothetical protein